MRTIDLRDGSVFPAYHPSDNREADFPHYPWVIQDDTLYTVSPSGILAWAPNRLQSRGCPTLGRTVWAPSTEMADSKRPPDFIDCVMGNGKAYLVLVHKWAPVY
jgi:hypothetical protein